MSEIGLECRDRLIFSLLSEDTSGLSLDRLKKSSISLLYSLNEFGYECPSWEELTNECERFFVVIDLHCEDTEIRSSVERECLVGLHARDEDREVCIYVELLHFSLGLFVQLLEHLVAFSF